MFSLRLLLSISLNANNIYVLFIQGASLKFSLQEYLYFAFPHLQKKKKKKKKEDRISKMNPTFNLYGKQGI